MIIATHVDGRLLEYDENHLQFTLGKVPVSLSEVRTMGDAGQLTWNMEEQRTWMNNLDEQVFVAEHKRVINGYSSAAPGPQATSPYGQSTNYVRQNSQNGGPYPPNNPQAYYAPQNPPNQAQGQAKKSSTKTVLIVVGVVLAVLLLCCCVCSTLMFGTIGASYEADWDNLDELESYVDELNKNSLNGSHAQGDLLAPIYLDELK